MPRVFSVVLVVLLTCSGSLTANPIAVAVGAFAADYLLGKGIDEIWDEVTNKPDVRELDQRISVVEDELRRLDPQLGDAVSALRKDVYKEMSLENYKARASKTVEHINYRLTKLEKRVLNNEETIARLESRIENLEKDRPDSPPDTDHHQATIGGEWTFQVSGVSSVDSSGRKRNDRNQIEIAMSLSQKGDYIKGEYLWASGNGCPKATVVGQKVGESFNLTIHYKGDCCGGAKMDFVGALISPVEIEGKFKPNGIPPNSNCNIWWANVVGFKEI